MGPPGGPEDSWLVYKGRLYLNFFPRVREMFALDIDTHIAQGNARWIGLWGSLKAGPFNTDCLAELWGPPSSYPCPPSGCRTCMNQPQIVPGITPASPPSAPPSGVYAA
jgi:hypothetical protein